MEQNHFQTKFDDKSGFGLYHTIGLGPSHFVHSKGVRLSQYINDHQLGQIRPSKCHPFAWSNLDLARAALFIATLILV